MQSLFPQHNAQTPGEKPLLEFKAGKCAMVSQEDGEFMVTPEEKRGNIAIVKGEGYVYFRWIDRSSNQMDVNCNWIVFQNSVVFKKINTGREEDRVYLLKWKDENRRLMFWMQDKSADKDEENCKQVNELFNNPAAVSAAVAAARGSTTAAGGGANPGADEWMRMLGLSPPAATTSGTSSTTSTTAPGTTAPPPAAGGGGAGAGNTQALDLARILAGLGANSNNIAPVQSTSTPAPTATTTTSGAATSSSNVPATSSSASSTAAPLLSAADLTRAFASSSSSYAASQGNNAMYNRNPTDLTNVLSADALIATGVLEDPTVRENLLRLLPEGQQSEQYLETNLRSPQFQQALDALGSALSSDSFNAVMANLGIDPAPGATQLMRGDFVAAFLTAANAAAAARREAAGTSSGQQQSGDSSGNGSGNGGSEDSKMDES